MGGAGKLKAAETSLPNESSRVSIASGTSMPIVSSTAAADACVTESDAPADAGFFCCATGFAASKSALPMFVFVLILISILLASTKITRLGQKGYILFLILSLFLVQIRQKHLEFLLRAEYSHFDETFGDACLMGDFMYRELAYLE